MDELYTPEVQKHLYEAKRRLPADFPLVTREEEVYIIIVVEKQHFEWRAVEDKLDIAIELENLRSRIEGTGIGCLIEKVEPTDWSG